MTQFFVRSSFVISFRKRLIVFERKFWKSAHSASLRAWDWRPVNVSPMSPKLFLSYPHREEYREINLATLFLWLVLLKLLCNQLKIFVNLTFSQKVWLFVLFWFTGFAELRVLQVQLHCSKKEVTFWLCCGKNVKFLKSIICD